MLVLGFAKGLVDDGGEKDSHGCAGFLCLGMQLCSDIALGSIVYTSLADSGG